MSSSKTDRIVLFSWYDYILFGLILSLSTLIGIYYGFLRKRKQNPDEYLFGSQNMKVFPISMSLISSVISGLTLLTVPAEIYLYGIYYIMICLGNTIAAIALCFIYLPVFYKTKITSVYEYLEMRFDGRTRIMASTLFCLWMFMHTPAIIYVPALAFSQVSGIDVHLITLILSGVCLFYTAIGGLKTVVWTDAFQLLLMIGGTVTVAVIGIIKIGGFDGLLNVAKEGNRLYMDFDVNPLKRDTFWAALFGLMVFPCAYLIPHQSYAQKFLALPTLKQGRMAAVIFGIGVNLIAISCTAIGIIVYVVYHDRDPFTLGDIKKMDELLPYFVVDVGGTIPGLPGIFIAGIVCAALSTYSAVLNSLAATIYKDMISPFIPRGKGEAFINNLLKLIVVVMGIVFTAMVFVIEHLGGLFMLQISLSSICTGALLAIFTLGVVFPNANAKGGLFGMIGSIIIMSWIVLGSQYYKVMGYIKYPTRPLTSNNQTFYSTVLNSTSSNNSNDEDVFWLYKISHYYYPLLGFIFAIIIGLVASKFTLKINDKVVHPNLIAPIFHRFLSEESKKLRYCSLDVALNLMSNEGERDSDHLSK